MIQEPPHAFTTAELVRHGVDLLDRTDPGWRDLIEIESFDITGSYSCILGQVYDGYDHGVEVLGRVRETIGDEAWERASGRERIVLQNMWAQFHGFLGPVALDGENEPTWDYLEEAWLAELD